ncbi:MAG: Ig-like domain-containing protein [Frankiales bacterium]|nr:Ig-like domain-containing protein [Frankiales bacterium]
MSSSIVAGASATSTGDIDATALASPTLAFFDVAGVPTPHVVVGTQGAVRSFRVSDLSAGPSFSAPGQSFQTPSVPVQPDGTTPNPGGAVKTAPRVYVASDDGTSTTVHALQLSGGALQQYATRTLAGRPAPALAVEQESEPTLAEAKLVVTTGANLFLLETGALASAGQLSDVALTAGTTGFRQTTAAASGELGYVTRDNADQVVFRISDGKAVTPAEFTSAAPAGLPNTGVGQPSLSRGFVQFSGGNGAFVYRNADTNKPTVTLTGPADGATVSGTATTLSAQAFDARGIAKVDFRLDGQVVGTDTAPDSGSPFGAPGATYTVTLDTTRLSNGSKVLDAVATDGGGLTTISATRRITVQNAPASSPPASPSPSTSPAPSCATPTQVSLERDTIIATGSAGVTVTAPANSIVDLFAYTRPSTTYRVVRSAEVGGSGVAEFRIVPPANTRLYAQVRGCTANIVRDSKVLNVRTALSLFAVRNGFRNYTFSGDSLPARPGGLIISLYRVTADGRQVLTSQTRASATTGDWVLNRRFTGTGRFGFVARTGQDLQNAPGVSNTRSLLVF